MATALTRYIALVSESRRVTFQELAPVSAAIDKQVQRDFAPIWDVSATVNAFARLEDVPIDAWPVIVMDDIGFSGAAGIHLDKDGQPYALVTASDNNDEWSLTASHECLEMLADPFGNRLVAGDSPKPDQGRVRFLVEVCDPSEAAAFAYTSNGVLVSDFYTPRFFDPVQAAGVRYSFTDAITEPRQVLQGGYLSWQDLTTGDWWQEIWFDGDRSSFRNLGQFTGAANESIRSWIDRQTSRATQAAIAPTRSAAMAAGLPRQTLAAASTARASSLRREIEALLSRPSGESDTGSVAERRRSAGRTRSGRSRDSA
jgi:hypothetical protein